MLTGKSTHRGSFQAAVSVQVDWEESFLLGLHAGKDEALDRGNYRGRKSTDQVIKLLERALDPNIREMGDIDEMQFLLVPGEGTTDAHRRHNCDWSGCRWHHA